MSGTGRLRVLHVPSWYPSEKSQVAGTFVREHVKASAIHNDVVVLYSEGVDTQVRGLYRVQENLEDGIRTLRLRYRKSPLPKTTYFVYLWAMCRVFGRLIKEGFRPDVIHAHAYSAAVPAVVVGMRYGIPVVVTEHFSGFPRKLVRGIERLKAKFAFEHAAVVCPVSEYLSRSIQQMGIRGRFEVVPNVVDPTLFSPEPTAHSRQENKKRLLTVALLTPKKGIPYLLQALATLKEKRDDFALDIVGDGPNRKDYEELAEELGLASIVTFHGFLPKIDVVEFMRQCDAFVLPSLVETFGVVLIEAMACGKPVIATDIGGPNEIISAEVGMLVPPGDPEALAEAVDYLLDHYHEYDASKIAEYVRSRYSYQAVGQELDGLYRAVVKESNEQR